MNYRFLTTKTNSKALYIFRGFFTTSSVKLFVVTVQIYVYNCVFQKKRKTTLYSRNLSHFENESTFWKIIRPSNNETIFPSYIMLKFVGFHLCTQYLALWIKKEQSQIWTKAILFQEVALTEIYNKKHPQNHFKGFGSKR